MKKDKYKIRVVDLLKSHPEGLTIADVVKKTGLARHTVLARLNYLVGEGKAGFRQINMAKLHFWKDKERDFIEAGIKKVKVQPLKEHHIKKSTRKYKKEDAINMEELVDEIKNELRSGKIEKNQAQLKEQREPLFKALPEKLKSKKIQESFIKTGIPGFDDLLESGIPKGSTILIAGGAGAGKTIFNLQTIYNLAKEGKKCLYMSFEESEEHLKEHMEDFGWDYKPLEKKGLIKIQRFNPFEITRSVDALLMKAKGELLIDIEPIIFPEGFKPDFIVVDSLTAIASAFTKKEDSYRIYIEQLFRFFEKVDATSFLISETKQVPTIFSKAGIEEFLADGVIVIYHIKKGNIRESAIEILKLRGAKHDKKIVAMQITEEGINVYPEQEVFSEI